MLLGCIADDFTGASDLANTLARGGMATTQFVGVSAASAPASCEAGVVALKTRTIPAADAVAQSLAALDWLLAQGCRQILFKYCSTFDSTPKGNIGPVAEALLDRLGGQAVVCPAFPATGRTLFNGHLFVGGRLLSETGLRDHPLTPMTDPDIVRWLSLQTTRRVGLVPFADVRAGSGATAAAIGAAARDGRTLIVVDALSDDDLRAIGEAVASHKLVTGGSGVALGLPENFRKAGLLSAAHAPFKGAAGPAVALSGSCSTQSLKQVTAFARSHPVLALLPNDMMGGDMTAAKAASWALERLDAYPMIYSSATPEEVAEAQRRFGREDIADRIEKLMAEIAVRLVAAGVQRLAVGGGETSGAVTSALGVSALTIGPQIDPGVPALAVVGEDLRLALKSGNFGAVDFFERAARALAGLAPGDAPSA